MADYTSGPGSVDQRSERALEIALALGIGSNRILGTPATMFAAYFASLTHLNRWGQQVYSAELVKQLAEVVK
ncbi:MULTISPECIES: hypothetical protein [Bradyrhizobium]|uniref:hypothetical protein n=1 Tax=Bradyrhizobium TaxID=374 RepID=UPI0013A5663C|nr:hypothetical protein [Bradyrhizobium diazoefficiens]QJS41079.1 hypothetical protein DI395_46410 [Bradyrhizobium diazoefficiens]